MSKLEFEKYWKGLPLLEQMITEYENDQYFGNTFESFIDAFYKWAGHFYLYENGKLIVK